MDERTAGLLTANRVLKIVLISVTLLASSLLGNLSAAPQSIRFRRISSEQGLSHAAVKCILQDRHGFMWFGTEEGLNLYDGYDFKVYSNDAEDPGSISHDWVWSILEDQTGVIWVGTDGGGLNRLERASDTFTRFRHDPADPTSLSHDRIRVILEDRSGLLWIGTDGGGLDKFDPVTQTFSSFNHDPSDPASLSHDRVRSLHEDHQGMLWVGTDGGGLNRLDPETGAFTHFRHDPLDETSLSDDRVRSLYEDRAGVLWIGTYEGGLNRLDPGSETFIRYTRTRSTSSLSANRVRDIYQDSEGALWIATDNGLNKWNPDRHTFERYQHDPTNPYSLSDNRVAFLYQDRGNVLWIATDGGLNNWNPTTEAFAHYKHIPDDPSALSSNVVTSFHENRDGHMWVGTFGGGLNRFEPSSGTFVHYAHDSRSPASLSDDRVMSLLVDKAGILWVGTFGSGLDRFDSGTGTFAHYRHDPGDPRSLSWNGVTAIFEDANDVLWVGTYRGGLNRFSRATQEFHHYRHDPLNPASLGNDHVLAIYEDKSAVLWIGTDGGGLNRFDTRRGIFTHYRYDPDDPNSLSSDRAWTIYEDSRGNLWVGTQGGGLNLWSLADRTAGRSKFKRYTKRNGLPSDVIYGILESEDGDLWMSTNRGLSKFDSDTETFTNYDITDGLQGNDFMFGAHHRSAKGQMFFGGHQGFNAFYPAAVRENDHVPPVVLTAFLKFNRPVGLGAPISQVENIGLSYKDYVVAFEFAALDYTAPEKNRYMYYLEGFDADWVDAGAMRRATYTNLEPGEYTFRVKGANNDGVWNEDGVAVAVTAASPPWATWWAYASYALIATALLYTFTRAQARKLERAEALRKANLKLKQEIAERKAKEKALQEQQDRAQTYLDIVEVIIVAINRHGEVTLINQKGCQVLGYDEDEILGGDWFDLFVPENVREVTKRNFRSGDVYDYCEYPLLTKTGDERLIAWHTTFLHDDGGAPSGTLSSGTDITEVRQLEKALHHGQKMEAIGTLAGGIAHDFNNALACILGYTAMTLEELPEDSEIADNLRQVKRGAERAKDLVGQILTFSRRVELERKPLEIQLVVKEALRLLRASLPSTIEFHEDIDADCAPVMADPTQIHQVVMNLCTNAYHAMADGGGVLEVSLQMVQIDATTKRRNPSLQQGPNVRLMVKDTGAGIVPDMLDRIFDPFYTTKKVGQGTGLGLSVVHGIVKSSRGEITVRSKAGEGTTVEIHLPCCNKVSLGQMETSGPVPRGQEHILFVDDEEDVAQMGKIMLERMGYVVTARTSGLDVLELFCDQPEYFDLIITDQTMPKMTGLELAREVRRIRPDFPIVLATGFGDVESSDAIRVRIAKPFVPVEIGRVVRQALGASGG